VSDASQDVPEAPIRERLADLIESMLNEWSADQKTCKVTLHMTFSQWDELLGILRLHQADEALRVAAATNEEQTSGDVTG